MTISTKLFSGACLALALFGGSSDFSSRAFTAEEQPAVATSDVSIDWTLFNVPQGKEISFYRERMKAFVKLFESLPDEVYNNLPAETRDRIEELVDPAHKVLVMNLMNDPEATEEERLEHFQTALFLIAREYDFASLESLLELEKASDKPNAERIASMESTLFTMKFRRAILDKNVPEMNAMASQLADLANKDIALASEAEGLIGMLARVDSELAKTTLKKTIETLGASEDAQYRALAKSLSTYLRFVSLQGSEMLVEGLFLDGTEIDWKSYRGKVVLVDIFATWCFPCMIETPNIQKNYERFHDAGFEVIGYSIDDDLDALKEYEKKAKLPWKCVSQALSMKEKNEQGEPKYKDLAKYCGVRSIPTLILVGKDGKVVELRARGTRLTELLEKEFPQVK